MTLRELSRTRVRTRRQLRPSLCPLESRELLSTFTVTKILDDGSSGTLRWAIGQANTAGGANTIAFSSLFNTAQKITLVGGQLDLIKASEVMTITGPSVGVTVSGNHADRVFKVSAGVTASISGLTITEGQPPAAAGNNDGGGLLIAGGTVTLTNCTVSSNTADGNGGGVSTNNVSTLTATNCTFSGNTADGNGGGVATFGFATLTKLHSQRK
jgi:fibronectin-binding autotransporter adhesin